MVVHIKMVVSLSVASKLAELQTVKTNVMALHGALDIARVPVVIVN